MTRNTHEIIVHEANDETIRGYIEGNKLRGKFVRFGDIIVLGAADNRSMTPLHRQIAFVAKVTNPDHVFKSRIQEASMQVDPADSIGKDFVGMVDAGHFVIDPNSVPPRLRFSDKSSDFGRADEPGRQRTVELAQIAVGKSIAVSAGA